MNKVILYEYINKLNKEDIINFCKRKNIDASMNEIDIIYSYIKNDYKRFLRKPDEIINEIKFKVSDNTFNELIMLYNKYKILL